MDLLASYPIDEYMLSLILKFMIRGIPEDISCKNALNLPMKSG